MADNLALSDVSRETMTQLQLYQDLLVKWTSKINLIAPSTIESSWERHVIDSAQVFKYVPLGALHLVDIGSGGGLPGLVIAILAKERMPGLAITLIESDQRKAAFLRTVARELDLAVSIKAERIEAVTDVRADVLTARALAPLLNLLSYGKQLLNDDGLALFQKGKSFQQEISQARTSWSFDLQEFPSETDDEARILQIKDIRRVIN
ncbi:16S rRNA (guanine(527)-N(7))-methyltransferase RsmG [Loktanella sp. R86503]|uniref:16S rRNA (guanine(527)-N(7))-methyltransferase RsmG n=1 Tax=Loktanella sp. R86503 TaxID=3093847 RepID=UPI0036D7E330